MKICLINSSPREDSFSRSIAELLLEIMKQRFEDEQIEETRFNLKDLNFRGCNACMECKESTESRCTLDDDLKNVLNEMEHSDFTILSTPIYFGTLNADAKALIDRGFSFLPASEEESTGKLKNTHVICLYSQGSTESNIYVKEFQKLGDIFNSMGAKSFFVISVVEPPEDIDQNTIREEISEQFNTQVIDGMLEYIHHQEEARSQNADDYPHALG